MLHLKGVKWGYYLSHERHKRDTCIAAVLSDVLLETNITSVWCFAKWNWSFPNYYYVCDPSPFKRSQWLNSYGYNHTLTQTHLFSDVLQSKIYLFQTIIMCVIHRLSNGANGLIATATITYSISWGIFETKTWSWSTKHHLIGVQ